MTRLFPFACTVGAVHGISAKMNSDLDKMGNLNYRTRTVASLISGPIAGVLATPLVYASQMVEQARQRPLAAAFWESLKNHVVRNPGHRDRYFNLQGRLAMLGFGYGCALAGCQYLYGRIANS